MFNNQTKKKQQELKSQNNSKNNPKKGQKANQKPSQHSGKFQEFFNEVMTGLYHTFGLKRKEDEINRIVSSLENKDESELEISSSRAGEVENNPNNQLSVLKENQYGQQYEYFLANNFGQEFEIEKDKLGTPITSGVRIKLSQNKESGEFLNFLDDLTSAMVGHKIADIPSHKRVEVVNQCADIFSNFIVEYVRHHYGPKHALRLKSARDFADHSIFEKFEELDEAFSEAFKAFILVLQGSTILVK